MADQQFCLRWNEHTGTMVKVFKQMLDSQAFVDCTLACEGKIIKAHKMILAACSPYLHTILEENTSKHPIIFLPHLKYSDIKALVDYMYCGEVYISFGHLPSLLKAAEVLRIKGLTDVTKGNNQHNNNNLNNGNRLNLSSSSNSDLIEANGNDTSGVSSITNPLEQSCDQNTIGAAAAVAAAAAANNHLGQLLGNNLNNLLGATNLAHLDNGDNSALVDIGNNYRTSSNLMDSSYGDEDENEYGLATQLALQDQEVVFNDDCSNEDANIEEESVNDELPPKTYLCKLCKCSFTAQSSLRRHMHRHYTDRERFECEVCHNSYSRKDYLKEHKKTKHSITT